jgi:membrane protein insertase Oxa1/YidC/SpoIIIJ
MPFFIALYWVLLSSVEMRNAPWIGWITDLSAKDPWFILPVLMTLSSLFQVWLNPTPPDPMQAKLMWFMPLAFSFMFFFFPAGLVLYWLTNNILSIAQQWFINTRWACRRSSTCQVLAGGSPDQGLSPPSRARACGRPGSEQAGSGDKRARLKEAALHPRHT